MQAMLARTAVADSDLDARTAPPPLWRALTEGCSSACSSSPSSLTGAWFAYAIGPILCKLGRRPARRSPTSVLAATDRNGIEVPPLRGFGPDATQMDANLQATPLWRILKREFPDWYAERLKEIVALTAAEQGR